MAFGVWRSFGFVFVRVDGNTFTLWRYTPACSVVLLSGCSWSG